MSLFQPRARPDAAQLALVKGWLRRRLALPDDAVVLVTELRCSEPGCPPIETVLATLDATGNKWVAKVPRPIGEVTEADVAGAQPEAEPPRGTSVRRA